MASPKDIFLTKEDLRNWWLSVNKKNDFLEVLAFAKSEMFCSSYVTADQIKGALALEQALLTIADTEPTAAEFPGPGLHHDLVVRKTADNQQPKE